MTTVEIIVMITLFTTIALAIGKFEYLKKLNNDKN